MTFPKTPFSVNDDYYHRLQRARRNKWRCDKVDAALIANYAVLHGEIEQEQHGRMVRHLEQGNIMRTNGGSWVCTTCGGNCGQCGMTDFIGNVGFSFDRIVAGINPEGSKPLDLEAKPPALLNLLRNKQGMSILGGYLVALAVLALVIGLASCTSLPPGTYVGSGTCDQCIGPYDVTLSSHRAALARGL